MASPVDLMCARAPGPPSRPRPRGVALITVLLVVALLSALAVRLIGSHALVLAQARHTFTGDQALAYALGGEAYARQILYEDFTQGQPGIDDLTESWAQPLPPLELDNGVMEIQIRDLNGCFNLASVAGADAQDNRTRLRTLLSYLALPETIADLWFDWQDADETVDGFGAEDGDYLLLEPPYRTANQMAGHPSELRLIANVEPEHVETLMANTCLYPASELKVNVNTAEPPALAALSPGLTPDLIEGFVSTERTYADVSEAIDALDELRVAEAVLAVTSEYFEISTQASVSGTVTELTSVVYRNPADGNLQLISRDFGKRFRTRFVAQPLEPPT